MAPNDRTLGLMEVGDYYYYPGWHEPGAMLETIVNEEALAALPEDLQAIRSPRGQPRHAG